jgi:hypothetical protein
LSCFPLVPHHLHTWNLKRIWDQIELLLGTSWGTPWNLMGTGKPKKIPLPHPKTQKRDKLAALIAYWAFSLPAWNFYYGPIPLHNRMDTYSAINRAEWAIPWNSRVLQFKKAPRPSPSLCLVTLECIWVATIVYLVKGIVNILTTYITRRIESRRVDCRPTWTNV